MSYESRAYTQTELALVMRHAYEELIDFVTSPAFRAVLEEMDQYPLEALPTFVKAVLLNKDALTARGVTVPPGILIQRSSFGDRRPTLFAVKKLLPETYHDAWENVNLTFDSPYADADVSRDAHIAWRIPLPIDLQAQLMTHRIPLESVSDQATYLPPDLNS